MTVPQLLKRFFTYDLTTAITCILIPFLLILTNGEMLESISAYAYTDYSFVYVFLLTLAATTITTIGIRKNQLLTWIIGLNLMLIPLTPHLMFPTIHLVVSAIFFGGMVFHIIKYSNKFKPLRWLLVLIIIVSFIAHYIFGDITLFVAESIGLIVFGFNFLIDLIEARKKLG